MTTSSLVLAFAAVAVGLNVAVVVDSSHDSDLDFDCDPFCPEFRACAEGVHAGDPFVSRACAIMLREAGRGAGADAAFKYLEIFWDLHEKKSTGKRMKRTSASDDEGAFCGVPLSFFDAAVVEEFQIERMEVAIFTDRLDCADDVTRLTKHLSSRDVSSRVTKFDARALREDGRVLPALPGSTSAYLVVAPAEEEVNFVDLKRFLDLHAGSPGRMDDEQLWLVLPVREGDDDSDDVMQETRRALVDSPLEIHTRFYLLGRDGEGEEAVVHIQEIYRKAVWYWTDSGGLVGVWNRESGLVMDDADFWERRKDLDTITIVGGVLKNLPFIDYTLDEDGKVSNVTGFYGDIWKELQNELGFTSWLTPSVDGNYGTVVKGEGEEKDPDNLEFDGLVGMIQRGEVDVAVADLRVTEDRSKVVEYTRSIVHIQTQMFIKAPSLLPYHWSLFTDPLCWDTWIAVGVFVVVSATLLVAVHHFTDKLQRDEVECNPEAHYTFSLGIFISLASLFMQGVAAEPTRLTTRMVFLSLFACGMLVFEFYYAALTAQIAVVHSKMPFHDLAGMYDHPRGYKIGSVERTAADELFSAGNDLHLRIFRDRYEPVSSVRAGLRRALREDDFVFVWPSDTVNALTADDPRGEFGPCQFAAARQVLFSGLPFSLAVSKDFPYTKLFNRVFHKWRETGKLSRLWERWRSSNPRMGCPLNVNALESGVAPPIQEASLTFGHIITLVLAFLLLVVLSAAILGCELLWRSVGGSCVEATSRAATTISKRKRKTSDSCEMMRMTPPLVLPRRDFVEVALYAQDTGVMEVYGASTVSTDSDGGSSKQRRSRSARMREVEALTKAYVPRGVETVTGGGGLGVVTRSMARSMTDKTLRRRRARRASS